MSELNTVGKEPKMDAVLYSMVEKNIRDHLSDSNSRPVIFCGNASVASKASDACDVTYVEMDSDTLQEVKKQHPGIRKVVKADVLDYIYFNKSSSLVISSEISANWKHAFQLEKLVTAIERNRYDFVVLEFADAEAAWLKGTEDKESLFCYLKRKFRKLKVDMQASATPSDPSFTIVISKK